MTNPDLTPAARRMADLVAGVTDDQLTLRTPCTRYAVGDLLDHIGGLSLAFAGAATKEVIEGAEHGPSGDASRLAPDWRAQIPTALSRLADAWGDPAAWSGMTKAGPIEMPGEIAGLVALEELVVHGWDLARAVGVPYDVSGEEIEAVRGLLGQFDPESRGDAYAPEVTPRADASPLDQVIALSGRDPAWSSPS